MALDSSTVGEINTKGLNLVWVIKNFKTKCLKAQLEDEWFLRWRSPDYHIDDSRSCSLSLAPHGRDESCKEFVSLFLHSTGDNAFDAMGSMYILNSSGQEVDHRDLQKLTFDSVAGFGFSDFIERSRLFSEPDLLKDGNLSIGCKLYIDSPFAYGIENITTLRGSTLVQEIDRFQVLLEDHKFSDLKLVVEDKEILVHKSIIASGSPVFEAMFSHPTKENEQNTVTIPDIKFNVMQELVMFIYAARVKNLENVAEDLLMAAEKYGIERLKEICESCLSEKLNVENVLQYLSLAEVHSASYLKKKCLKFIENQVEEIVESKHFDEWKLNTDIMKEVFRTVVRARISQSNK